MGHFGTPKWAIYRGNRPFIEDLGLYTGYRALYPPIYPYIGPYTPIYPYIGPYTRYRAYIPLYRAKMTHFGPILGPHFGPLFGHSQPPAALDLKSGPKKGSQNDPKMGHFGPFLTPIWPLPPLNQKDPEKCYFGPILGHFPLSQARDPKKGHFWPKRVKRVILTPFSVGFGRESGPPLPRVGQKGQNDPKTPFFGYIPPK